MGLPHCRTPYHLPLLENQVLSAFYKIGDLAALSGVPIKTIRYYSDLGLLPPATVRGKLRLYSDAERARLSLIRALREIDVDLASIQRLLESRTSIESLLSMQLDAVEVGMRTLARRRVVLRRAIAHAPDDATYLDRLHRLAGLDALERRTLVEDYLDRAFEGIPVDERWKADFRRMVVFDVPDDPTDAQLDAWLELATLLTDQDFIDRMREIGAESWSQRPAHDPGWHNEALAVQAEALRLADANEPHDSPAARALLARYVEAQARAAGEKVTAAFTHELMERIDRNSDPRAIRFWELVATLKGWKDATNLPTTRAYRWLFATLRDQVTGPARVSPR